MVETLTPEQIDQMPAGKELDALIAKYVFNAEPIKPEQADLIKQIAWQFSHHGNSTAYFVSTMFIRKLERKNPDTGCDFEFIQPYDYSSRNEYAWTILYEFDQWEIRRNHNDYVVVLNPYHFSDGRAQAVGEAKTLALAACRAALKAKINDEALNKRGEM